MSLLTISFSLLAIFFMFQLMYIFIPMFSVSGDRRIKKETEEQGMSIIVPAYNEEKVILSCINSIEQLHYQNYEAIIVNDGSTDSTLQVLHNHLKLEPVVSRKPSMKLPHERVKTVYQSMLLPYVFVIDKENGGKADALNAGTEYALHDVVITLDADSVLDGDSLHAINTAFSDEKVIAAGGMVQIGQGFDGNQANLSPAFNKQGLIRYQIIQYLTDFYLHKSTQGKFKAITVISGAFGAFRKYALFETGGYRKTLGEDMDITLQIHRLIKTAYKSHKMLFVPEAVCYTECPETLKDLFKQRVRWQKGFIDCMLSYKTAFFRQLGFSASIYLIVDSLILGTLNAFPLIIVPVMLLANPNDLMVTLGAFTIAYCLASYRSVAAIIISRRFGHKYSKRDYAKITWFIPLEILTYRLLGLLFVTAGTVLYLKNKEDWSVSRRIGNSFLVEEKKAG